MQNTEAWLVKYAVDANLFRLESTNPKKNSQTPEKKLTFLKKKNWKFFFLLKMFEHLRKKKKFRGLGIFFRIGGPIDKRRY